MHSHRNRKRKHHLGNHIRKLKFKRFFLSKGENNILQTNRITDNICRNYFELQPISHLAIITPIRGNIHHEIAISLSCVHTQTKVQLHLFTIFKSHNKIGQSSSSIIPQESRINSLQNIGLQIIYAEITLNCNQSRI